MRKRTILFVTVALTTLVFIFNSSSFDETTILTTETEAENIQLSTTTLPVVVSGLVEAADTATIYAKTSGVVYSLPLKEGSSVNANDVIAVQSTVVVDAQVRLAQAKSKLVASERASASLLNKIGVKSAVASLLLAKEKSALKDRVNQARINETTDQLSAGVKASFGVILAAVDYINNNRSLFTAAGLDTYDMVLEQIYGQAPTYFTNILAPRPDQSFLSLKTLIEQADTSVQDAQIAGDQTVKVLQSLDKIFATAEDDVFNRRNSPPAVIKEAYFSQKSSVTETLLNIQGLLAASNQTIDASLEDVVSQQKSVTLSGLDKAAAQTQLDTSNDIAEKSEVVQAASVGVAAAERSLGTIRAPFSGYVAEVLINKGEYAVAGSPILKLVGSGAKEMTVTVPRALGNNLASGQSVLVDGEAVGVVDRFNALEAGHGFKVIISFNDDSFSIGETVRGYVEIDTVDDIFSVPRQYVHFDSDGALVYYQNGELSRVQIVYDNGGSLFLKVDDPKNIPLVTQRVKSF